MKYVLNESVMLHESTEEGILISVTGSEIVNICDKEDEVLEVFRTFSKPMTYENAYMEASRNLYIAETDFQECFEFMRLNNILKEAENVKSLDDFHMEKYKRQISSLYSLPGIEKDDAVSMQERLCNSCVCLLGVGGIGSHLALALTSIGVERLILVDFDRIELSNTSRQVLYDESDVGRVKVEVAKEKLQKYNSRAEIKVHNVHIESQESLDFLKDYQIDLLVLCADTPRGEIQYIVDNVAKEQQIPWFCYGPYNHSQITMGPLLIPGKGKSYSDIYPHNVSAETNKISSINNRFVASICDPYNGFASMFAAIEVFKFLTGVRTPAIMNRRYYINTDTWEMEHIDYD